LNRKRGEKKAKSNPPAFKKSSFRDSRKLVGKEKILPQHVGGVGTMVWGQEGANDGTLSEGKSPGWGKHLFFAHSSKRVIGVPGRVAWGGKKKKRGKRDPRSRGKRIRRLGTCALFGQKKKKKKRGSCVRGEARGETQGTLRRGLR